MRRLKGGALRIGVFGARRLQKVLLGNGGRKCARKLELRLVLGLNGGRIIQGRIIPSNTVSYDEQVKMPV